MPDLRKRVPDDSNYITISLPMNRITVRDFTLEKMGNPQFISFMMQDDGKAAILKATNQSDDQALTVPKSRPRKKYQFGGKVLVGLIRDSMGWNEKLSYRITAETIEDNMLYFDFTKAVPSTSYQYRALLEEDPDELLVSDPEEEETEYFWKDTGAPVVMPTDENGEIIIADASQDRKPEDETKERMTVEDDLHIDLSEDMNWASEQMANWGWNQGRISAWLEEREANVSVAAKLYLPWKTGDLAKEDFLVHHRELEQMDFAFELGRRVSIIRRIRANLKAFNPTMMAIIYDERAEICESILNFIKRYPALSDFDIAMRVNWG